METDTHRPDRSPVRLVQRLIAGTVAFIAGCLIGWLLLTPELVQPALGLVAAAGFAASVAAVKRREAAQRHAWIRRIE